MDDNRASRKLLPRYMNIPSLVSFAFARPFEYNVLVLRQRTRRFLDEVRLLRSLRETTGQQWQTYKGSETVEETLRLFRSARTAVGFHGAGLMNMVFSQAPLPQVYEVTTRLNGGKLWRSYLGKIVRTWNSRASGVVHVVPLQRILQANQIRQLSDSMIKNVRWIPLSRHDVGALACYIRTNTSTPGSCEIPA